MKKLLSVFLVLLIGLSLFGCTKKEIGPSTAVDTYINELKSTGKDKISEYIDSNLTDTNGIIKAIATEYVYDLIIDFDYSYSNEVIDNDKATIDVNIKAYNLGSMLLNVAGDYIKWLFENMFSGLTEDQQKEQLILLVTNAISEVKAEGKTVETTIPVTLNKVNDEWVVDESSIKDNLVDAVTGGLKSSLGSILSQFSN